MSSREDFKRLRLWLKPAEKTNNEHTDTAPNRQTSPVTKMPSPRVRDKADDSQISVSLRRHNLDPTSLKRNTEPRKEKRPPKLAEVKVVERQRVRWELRCRRPIFFQRNVQRSPPDTLQYGGENTGHSKA